jgi:enoyl-CoA hydratase/carnithine racemase
MSDELRVEDREGVRWIVLHRPESRNGLTLPLVERLGGLVGEAGAAPAVRVLVLSGEGGAFCSGLDLKSILGSPVDPAEGIVHFHTLVRNLRGVLKPTLAAIDGPAAGFGADLAMACDMRLASARAQMGERFVRIGLMPDGGGTWFLPRLVGLGRAFELLYEGRMLDAAEADRIGLVNRVLPVEGFFEAVQSWAANLAKGPPLAYARIKSAVLLSTRDFDDALDNEREGQLDLLQTGDFMEGVQAFLARRPPAFQGR